MVTSRRSGKSLAAAAGQETADETFALPTAGSLKTNKVSKASTSESESWLSPNPAKRAGELFFWKWHVAWLIFFGGIVVTRAYEVRPPSLPPL